VTRRLVEENKIFALTAATGTAQSVAVIPYAKEVGLPMIGPIGTGCSSCLLISIGPSFATFSFVVKLV